MHKAINMNNHMLEYKKLTFFTNEFGHYQFYIREIQGLCMTKPLFGKIFNLYFTLYNLPDVKLNKLFGNETPESVISKYILHSLSVESLNIQLLIPTNVVSNLLNHLERFYNYGDLETLLSGYSSRATEVINNNNNCYLEEESMDIIDNSGDNPQGGLLGAIAEIDNILNNFLK